MQLRHKFPYKAPGKNYLHVHVSVNISVRSITIGTQGPMCPTIVNQAAPQVNAWG